MQLRVVSTLSEFGRLFMSATQLPSTRNPVARGQTWGGGTRHQAIRYASSLTGSWVTSPSNSTLTISAPGGASPHKDRVPTSGSWLVWAQRGPLPEFPSNHRPPCRRQFTPYKYGCAGDPVFNRT
jgi:hypothetical protein